MSLDDELAHTLRAVRGLKAQRQDDLEDYFHDAIVVGLTKERSLEDWLPYLYKSVYHRIAYGREGRVHLPLEEQLLPESHPTNIDIQVDVRSAITKLTPTQQEYIYAYFYLGHTSPEIAMLYDVTKQAVDQTLSRGLESMRRILSGEQVE